MTHWIDEDPPTWQWPSEDFLFDQPYAHSTEDMYINVATAFCALIVVAFLLVVFL